MNLPVPRSNWSGQPWLLIAPGDLATELLQAAEEGRDLSAVTAEFEAIAGLDLADEANQQRAEALLDRVATLPTVTAYPYREPSDLPSIQAARPAQLDLPTLTPDRETLLDKALGGWCGRAAGCLLGKPVEGRRSWQIRKYLESLGEWPLNDYFSNRGDPATAQECGFNLGWAALYREGITCMVEDDDTNYTVTGLAVRQRFGPDFTPADVARFWLSDIPIFHVCTAERVAYRNLVAGIAPPDSAWVRNYYREWIGAQIRADFFGYVNPANPERAAEYAWRDAAISHVKNGIYGEMWVAAMLAYAFVCDDVETVIRAGLAQIPAKSRLTAAIERIICLKHEGMSYEDVIADVHARWDENYYYKWVHTISNAEITAIALLWGEMDFEKTICYSVMPGFDTDCNGATAGSVLGVMLGADRLPAKWIAPMNDTLLTGVAGYYRVSLTQLAQESVDLMHIVRGA